MVTIKIPFDIYNPDTWVKIPGAVFTIEDNAVYKWNDKIIEPMLLDDFTATLLTRIFAKNTMNQNQKRLVVENALQYLKLHNMSVSDMYMERARKEHSTL